jgi:hypothetical protein
LDSDQKGSESVSLWQWWNCSVSLWLLRIVQFHFGNGGISQFRFDYSGIVQFRFDYSEKVIHISLVIHISTYTSTYTTYTTLSTYTSTRGPNEKPPLRVGEFPAENKHSSQPAPFRHLTGGKVRSFHTNATGTRPTCTRGAFALSGRALMEGEKSTVAFSCRHPPQNSIAALKKASQVFLARVSSNR